MKQPDNINEFTKKPSKPQTRAVPPALPFPSSLLLCHIFYIDFKQ